MMQGLPELVRKDAGKGKNPMPLSSMLMMNPLKTERMMWESMVKGQDPRAAMRDSMDPDKNLSEDGKFWSTLGSAFIKPYQKAIDEGKPMEAVGRGAFEVATLLLGGAEAKAGKVAAEGATVAKTVGKVGEGAQTANKVTEVAQKANKVSEGAGATERAAQVTGKIEAVGKTELVTQKAGAKKTLPKSNSGKTKSKSSSKKEPISSTGKVQEVENLQSGGLENRGYHPKADERRTTKVEYKTQSSAKRNFPGQQNHENCVLQSSQQITRASNGKNLSEVDMEKIAKKVTDYERDQGTTVSQAPNILETQGVRSNLYLNDAENIQTAIEAGLGVMSHHDVRILWGHDRFGTHTIHPTGVVRNAEGVITDYIINDTGLGYAGQKIPAKQFEESLISHPNYPATITDESISYGGRTASEARRRANKARNKDEHITNTENVTPDLVAPVQKKMLQGLVKDEPRLERLLERVPDPLELKVLLKQTNNPELLERMLTVTKSQKLDPKSIQVLYKKLGPDIGTYLAKQSDSEIAAAFKAMRLEEVDSGHSLMRHGPQVTEAALEKRLKTGVAPDGKISFSPASTKFNSYENWIKTHEIALQKIKEKYGVDLANPPSGNQKSYEIKIRYDRAIDEGFIPDLSTKNKTTLVDPITSQPKKGNVFGAINPIDGVTGTYTKVTWDGHKWKVIQHFPLAENWDNAIKVYTDLSKLDALVKLP
jgi:hypothetical protein